jgi:hypothetical protein
LVATDLLSFVISTINFENPKNSPKLPRILISRFVEFFVVLIQRFDVLGVDLHCLKFSSLNSSYFSRIRRFSISVSAQIDEQLAPDFSKKCEPEKAGLCPAKAGLIRGNPLGVARSSRIHGISEGKWR